METQIAQMTAYTSRLINKLKDGKPGDALTDEQLEKIAERDVRAGQPGYANLASAIRHCRWKYGVIWERIRGAGVVKCLMPDEIHESCDSDFKGIGRRARRAGMKLAAVKLESLDADGKKKHLTRMAQAGAIGNISKNDFQKKLEQRTAEIPQNDKLLEAFLKT